MRKYSLLIITVMALLLSGCEVETGVLDYDDFQQNKVSSYSELESQSSGRYIAYYYSETCSHCIEIKPEILNFFSGLEDIPFYLLDIVDADDRSGFEEFIGTPTLMLLQDGEILEMYIGSDRIKVFIESYTDFDIDNLEYSYFNNQHLTTYDEVLNIESEAYIIYYYLENCPHCIRAKADFLKWAWQRGYDEIYFMNGAKVVNPDNKPTELIILNSGTPILVIMKNGEFANEYYSGTDAVLGYIEETGLNEITTENYTE